MEQEKINEGNKLIAEFMGYKMTSSDKDFTFFENKTDDCIKIQSDRDYQVVRRIELMELRGFRFHNSWDWLMPVVEKIEQLLFPNDVFYNIHILSGCCVCIISSDMDELGQYSEPTKILTVFKAVVEFIKWYNENKE